tara:strand:+ start:381 stop:797 length:417 start_codon:yes stop_codon:yes gene_type:complete
MKIINIRFYLPDFLKVYDSIKEPLDLIYTKSVQPIKIFFWYNADDDIKLDSLKDFIVKWEDKQHFKTIIRPTFEDSPVDFIWFDIMPKNEKVQPKNIRFSYRYTKLEHIVKGLEYLKEIMTFTTKSTIVRKQKRTDLE